MSDQIQLPARIDTFMQDVVLKINPNFRIRNKAHPDTWYWLASKIVGLFNKEMDTRYVTVINGQCWFPSEYFDKDGNMQTYHEWNVIRTLAHESVHEFDRKRLGTVPFTVLYLFPQIFAVFALLSFLAFWNLSWLWCLLFLLLLAPIPAPGRAWLEARAYRVNMSFGKMSGWDPEIFAKSIYDQNFESPAYYFMMPFKGWVFKRLLDTSHENEEPYKTILEWYSARKEI